MRDRFSHSVIMAAIAAAGGIVTCISTTPTSAQAPAASVTTPPAALKTPWGEPIYREFGKTNLIRPYSALPNMRIRNFSPKHSEPNWTKSAQ
jgi:hypothetical protein